MHGRFAAQSERPHLGLALATLIALAAPASATIATAGGTSLPVSGLASGALEDKAVWSGSVELPDGMKLEIFVELAKDSGTISIPLQHAKDVPLSDVVVTAQSMKFAIPSAGAAWELAVEGDGKTATGVLRQAR